MTPKLVLTGFMATGKSAVGLAIAARLGWRFIDSDAEIVAREGRPIAAIFSADGEAKFRALEREVIVKIAGERRHCPQCHGDYPAVVSTGGGALADEANATALKRCGVVICLTARPEVIAARVGRSQVKRPKLLEGGKALLDRVRELMNERAGAYARADVTVDTSNLSIEDAADRVLAEFAARAYKRCVPSA
jgi:shikimate kinase